MGKHIKMLWKNLNEALGNTARSIAVFKSGFKTFQHVKTLLKSHAAHVKVMSRAEIISHVKKNALRSLQPILTKVSPLIASSKVMGFAAYVIRLGVLKLQHKVTFSFLFFIAYLIIFSITGASLWINIWSFGAIFFGFFVFFFKKDTKENNTIEYTNFLLINWASSFVAYALAYFKLIGVDDTQEFFNGVISQSSEDLLINLIICGISFIFMCLLTLNLHNAKIFIIELPFLVNLVLFAFSVAACTENFMLLFILIEIITLTTVVAAALYFITIGPQLIKPLLKFFVLNLLISAVFLLGVSFLMYNIPELGPYLLSFNSVIDQFLHYKIIGQVLNMAQAFPIVTLSVILILAALCFKLTLAPFSIWVVEIYAHLPQLFFLMLLTIYKIVYSVLFLKIIVGTMHLLPTFQIIWQDVAFMFALPSMFVGCLAFRTQDLGKILAYTTVSNFGYIVSGFVAATDASIQYSLMYLIVYCLQLLCIFSIFIILHKKRKISNLNQLINVKHYGKLYYYVLIFIFFSFGGIPPLAGFFTKYFLFLQIYTSGQVILAIAGLISSFILSIIYLQIALQLVLVKKTSYQALYYELSKNDTLGYSTPGSELAESSIFFLRFFVISVTVLTLFFIFILPQLAIFFYELAFLVNFS